MKELLTIEDLENSLPRVFNDIKLSVGFNIDKMKNKYPNKTPYQMIEQEYLTHYNYPFKGYLLPLKDINNLI